MTSNTLSFFLWLPGISMDNSYANWSYNRRMLHVDLTANNFSNCTSLALLTCPSLWAKLPIVNLCLVSYKPTTDLSRRRLTVSSRSTSVVKRDCVERLMAFYGCLVFWIYTQRSQVKWLYFRKPIARIPFSAQINMYWLYYYNILTSHILMLRLLTRYILRKSKV